MISIRHRKYYLLENKDRNRRFQGTLIGAPILYKNQSNQNTYQVWMGQNAFVLDSYFVSKFDNQSIDGDLSVKNLKANSGITASGDIHASNIYISGTLYIG